MLSKKSEDALSAFSAMTFALLAVSKRLIPLRVEEIVARKSSKNRSSRCSVTSTNKYPRYSLSYVSGNTT